MTPFLSRFASIPVLAQGFVRLVDTMGGDGSVVEAARVTTGKGRSRHDWTEGTDEQGRHICRVCEQPDRSKGTAAEVWTVLPPEAVCLEGDRRLIRYMLKNAHWSPFEFAEMSLHLKLPMDVWRQLVRYWSLSVQEYSTRYSPAVDAIAATAPDAWRAQGKGNRQGSGGLVTEWPSNAVLDEIGADPFNLVHMDATPGLYLSARGAKLHDLSREVYKERLAFGVAKEQARKDLPLSNYTEVYLKGNLRDWLNMLAQRLDVHAQHEIREYAKVIAEIVKAWAPLTWEAFTDYRLEARTFSRQEVAALKHIISGWASRVQAEAEAAGVEGPTEVDHIDHALTAAGVTSERERRAFLTNFNLLESE